jgi:hypothetical protein
LMATNNEIDNSGTSIEMRGLYFSTRRFEILISFFRFATEKILIGISSCQNGRGRFYLD